MLNFLLEAIQFVLIWLIVPCITLVPLFCSRAITKSPNEVAAKLAAEAGLLAGFILFVIYIAATRVNDFISIYISSLDSSGLISLGIGCILGFCVLWLVD